MDTIANRPPTSFWVAAGLLLIWTLIGCAVYFAEVGRDISALPPEQQRLFADIPIWSTAVFAIAVWSALAAAILLLLRRRLAIALFALSLAAIIVNDIYWFVFTDMMMVLGAEAVVMPLIVLVIGLFALWYARRADAHGWLR